MRASERTAEYTEDAEADHDHCDAGCGATGQRHRFGLVDKWIGGLMGIRRPAQERQWPWRQDCRDLRWRALAVGASYSAGGDWRFTAQMNRRRGTGKVSKKLKKIAWGGPPRRFRLGGKCENAGPTPDVGNLNPSASWEALNCNLRADPAGFLILGGR